MYARAIPLRNNTRDPRKPKNHFEPITLPASNFYELFRPNNQTTIDSILEHIISVIARTRQFTRHCTLKLATVMLMLAVH